MHEIMRYIASSVREQYEGNPEFESATRADKQKMPAVESQKSAAEDRQNKERKREYHCNGRKMIPFEVFTQLADTTGERKVTDK